MKSSKAPTNATTSATTTVLEPLEVRDRLIVVGMTGTGKSTWLKKHLEREIAAGRRVLFGDYHDEYSQAGKASEHVVLGPLAMRATMDELLDNLELLDDPALSLAVVMDNAPRAAAEEAAILVDIAQDTGDLLLGFDEVGMWGSYAIDTLHVAATQSRHWGVPLVLASQAMVDIHPKARRQATHLVSLRQRNPADLDAIAEITGSKEFAEQVARLELGESKHWRDSFTPHRKEAA